MDTRGNRGGHPNQPGCGARGGRGGSNERGRGGGGQGGHGPPNQGSDGSRGGRGGSNQRGGGGRGRGGIGQFHGMGGDGYGYGSGHDYQDHGRGGSHSRGRGRGDHHQHHDQGENYTRSEGKGPSHDQDSSSQDRHQGYRGRGRGSSQKRSVQKIIVHHHYSPAPSPSSDSTPCPPPQLPSHAPAQSSAAGPQYQISLSIAAGGQAQQATLAPQPASQYQAPPQHQQYTASPQHQQYTAPPQHQQYTAPPQHQQYTAPPSANSYTSQYGAPSHSPQQAPQYGVPPPAPQQRPAYHRPLLDLPPPYEAAASYQQSQPMRGGPREEWGDDGHSFRSRRDSTSSVSSSASSTTKSQRGNYKGNQFKASRGRSNLKGKNSKEFGNGQYDSAQDLSHTPSQDKRFSHEKKRQHKTESKSTLSKEKDSGADGRDKPSCFSSSHMSNNSPGKEKNYGYKTNAGKKKVYKGENLLLHKTKAVLQIRDYFSDNESVKTLIEDNLMKTGDMKLEFVEDAILTTRERALCTITLQHEEMFMGKILITEMCKRIRKKLRTEVTFESSISSESRSKKEEETTRENVKDNKEVAVSDPEKNLSKTNVLEENRSGSEERKRKPKNISKSKSPDPSLLDDASGADKGDVETKGGIPPVPTALTVRVAKVIASTDSVLQYFKQTIGSESCTFEVDSLTIQGDGKTQCKLMTPSKAACKRLRTLLNTCKDVEICDNNEVRELEESVKSEVQKERSVFHVQNAKDTVATYLKEHKGRMKQFEASLAAVKGKSSKQLSVKDQSEILALEDKLEEARLQKGIFQERCEKLLDDIENGASSAASKEDHKMLLHSIGIECKRLSSALPMYARRNDILKVVSSNQVSIIVGETGSGKSTQMAQYICESGIAAGGMIACTQPRKIAARTLAERVAVEMAGKVGQLVGYQTGALKRVGPLTKIVFMTDFSLLNEFLQDSDLSAYSCIIVDEAHERSIYTDILLGMIKSCLQRRPELKVVITSATIDPEIFIKYFAKKPALLHVSGRTFPVDVVYESSDEAQDFENIETKAISKVVDIHNSGKSGDILVFLTSAVEIMHCCEEIQKRLKGQKNFECFPLHGKLPPEEQQKVFKRLDEGVRKIVFATNCAETSVTIDGIKFVVDTGVAKEKRYDPKKNISLLGTHVIGQSSADQRKGRVGRTASGICYRLYSKQSFLGMAASSEPEILRIHLGEAMLKLAELGVDGRSYDFVEPPSQEALDTAVNALIEIGALKDSKITEIGRWISKLPFDPRQGLLVYLGYKDDLLFDTVVLAALLSNGSDIFYKGLTDTDEQNSAKNKNQFASPFGDAFTWLNVYQAWSSVPKKQQSAWCLTHSVNYKVMGYTRQCIGEAKQVLLREHGIEVEEKYSTAKSAPDRLRKIIFRANLSMLGHYLGHHRAGYYATGIQRQVHFHPSSSLMSQNSHPQWIVYSEFIKTSRDFIKGITVVEEAWVEEAVRDKKLTIDIAEVKGKKIHLIHHEEVGTAVFRALVGPRYRNLTKLEDDLTSAGMETVVTEADRDLGTVDVFSATPSNNEVITAFDVFKQMTIQGLQSREQEFPLCKTDGKDQGGCRITLGQGAAINSILMPGQSNTILIRKAADDKCSVQDMKAKFSAYGEIKDCFQFKCKDPWGKIRYANCSEAEKAARETKNDENNIAVLKIEHAGRQKVGQFQARLSWYRRPVKGKGIAFIKCSTLYQPFLIGQSIILNSKICEIKMSDKGEDLICFNIGTSSEDDIKSEVLTLLKDKCLSEEALRKEVFISIAREQRECLSAEEMSRTEKRLADQFREHLSSPQDTCRVDLKEPRKTDVRQVGFVNFSNPVAGFHACQSLQGSLTEGEVPVEISAMLKTSIHVPRGIMKVNELQFNDLIEGLKKHKATEVTKVALKQGDFRLDICSQDARCIVEAREIFQSALDGEVIECGRSTLLECLLTKPGLDAIRQVEKSKNVLIVVNSREKNLHIYGKQDDMAKAIQEIDMYLSKLVDGREECISLKGANRPPGLMKALLLKCGDTLDSLRSNFDLSNVKIDFKSQKLYLVGQDEALKNCIASIEELAQELGQCLASRGSNQEMPECVACTCPVESSSDLYRLEGCGHCYCTLCIKVQVRVSVEDKHFPVVCAREDCGKPLVWRDFETFLKNKWIEKDKLVQMSLNAFVERQPDRYKFCTTPNCSVAYEVTLDPNGCVFTCPLCSATVCSSCGGPSHPGLTCEMAKKWSDAEQELEQWFKENPGQRKNCPHCKTPIEKIEGCNKMHCSACDVIFCWLCLEVFPNDFQGEQLCYAHLQREHGGFV